MTTVKNSEKPSHLPKDWEDDLKMTVMFSPFRDKNLNPKSWDQKVKFWSELILEDCVQSKQAIVDVVQLKEKFRRKGKSPSGLETVIQEMISKGQLKRLSDIEISNTEGWLSWGYSKLVKKPIGWSMKWLSGQQEDNVKDTFVVMEVIKDKARQLLEIRHRLVQTDSMNIVEYSHLHDQHQELCPTDTEFSLVMRELVDSKEVVIQQAEADTKLVKFIQKDKKEKKVEKINEQDMHIHRIQKAHSEVKRQVEVLSTEVQRLATEAVSYKQKGMTKLAMSCMRKRRLAQLRIDKLTGSMETLEEILYRIKQAESNEMIVKAIEGGTSVLRDLTSKTAADDVNTVMDNLADVTQTQEDIMAELGTTSFIDEPSQSELEDELSIILSENTPPKKSFKTGGVDSDIERELDEILNETDEDSNIMNSSKGLEEMLDDLQLPDVPSSSPSKPRQDRKLLTS
ncbi:charged multivesicular body protein 7-like [Mercenaria mercenaria]|uniref:charged multivesicular body protein 7-like n=1 Tax=Mercenaria mercenaria TaxID=6596 RepID=UPI00234E5208|nr:charged multivesicular body protein 7-like [Mercenaria mercenaria]XP_045190540.2 charged multivesicular body protein 7-like [Mercenaria mercenaria]